MGICDHCGEPQLFARGQGQIVNIESDEVGMLSRLDRSNGHPQDLTRVRGSHPATCSAVIHVPSNRLTFLLKRPHMHFLIYANSIVATASIRPQRHLDSCLQKVRNTGDSICQKHVARRTIGKRPSSTPNQLNFGTPTIRGESQSFARQVHPRNPGNARVEVHSHEGFPPPQTFPPPYGLSCSNRTAVVHGRRSFISGDGVADAAEPDES